MHKIIFVGLSLFIAGCGSDSSPETTSAARECAGTTNLLTNGGLRSSEEQLVADWNSTQHGAIPSFLVTADDGIVTVERIGPEPWYNLVQFVDLKSSAGHAMLLEADLKLSLNSDDWPHALEPKGGLQVGIWALGEIAMLGPRLTLESVAEHSPNLGETDWFRAQVRFTVPERPQRSRVGLIHQANGSLSVRDIALFDCGPAPMPEPEAEAESESESGGAV